MAPVVVIHRTLSPDMRSDGMEIEGNIGAILLGVISSIALAIFILLCWCCGKSKKKKKKKKDEAQDWVMPEKIEEGSKKSGAADLGSKASRKSDHVQKTSTAARSDPTPLLAQEKTKTITKDKSPMTGARPVEVVKDKQAYRTMALDQAFEPSKRDAPNKNVLYRTLALDQAFEPSKIKPPAPKAAAAPSKDLYRTVALDEAFEPSVVMGKPKPPSKAAVKSLGFVASDADAYRSLAGLDDVFAPSMIKPHK